MVIAGFVCRGASTAAAAPAGTQQQQDGPLDGDRAFVGWRRLLQSGVFVYTFQFDGYDVWCLGKINM